MSKLKNGPMMTGTEFLLQIAFVKRSQAPITVLVGAPSVLIGTLVA